MRDDCRLLHEQWLRAELGRRVEFAVWKSAVRFRPPARGRSELWNRYPDKSV